MRWERRPCRPARTLVTGAALVALLTIGAADYTVRPGDTLSGIAARHGTTVPALLQANGLRDANRITAGRSLRLTGNAAATGATHGSTTYVVRPGDALSVIARLHGTSMAELARTNQLRDPHHIEAGRRLTVPARSAAGGAGSGGVDRAAVGALIDRTARQHGWSPAFVKALAWQESGWNNQRVSSAGAIGIMQVMPGTGTFVSRELLGRELDLTDPEDNVLAGVTFLQYLWELTDGDQEETLAGYYQGLRSVRLNGRYASTERYVANVLALRERFR